tara:strand:+ start:453 stop:638 length:186 start_codon:yes stop_codon:yes gene_type:complete
MERLYTSRKLWGALLGSISAIVLILITPDLQIGTALMYNGALWGAAITGQGIADYIKEKKT